MGEIGGEFYSYDNSGGVGNFFEEYDYTCSGRASLNYIIEDIKQYRDVKRALLPSYCCDSMIIPFVNHDMQVEFYNIFIDDDGNMSYDFSKYENECGRDTVVLAMDYFGYDRNIVTNIFEDSGKTVIKVQDATHSFFSDKCSAEADYYFASLRKWTRFAGLSVCKKINGEFAVEMKNCEDSFFELRSEAAELKRKYIYGENIDKQIFLNEFNRAEELLDKQTEAYKANSYDTKMLCELDVNKIISGRRNNAKILVDELSDVDEVNLLFKEIKDDDCPVFVPITVDREVRDKLKMYLIEKEIFCPVHWPLTAMHGNIGIQESYLFDCEISLICDQRYSNYDMKRIATEIKRFFKDVIKR